MSHPNAVRLQDAYEAARSGNLDPLFALFADDIRWHVNGGPLAGDYVGTAEVLSFFGRTMDLYAGTLTLDVVDVLAGDEHAVVLTAERGQHAGRTVAFRSVHLYELRGGQCARFDVYFDDAYAAFWSSR